MARAARRMRRRAVRSEMLPRFGSKTRSSSKTRTLPLISRLRRQLPPKGKPWGFCNPTAFAPHPCLSLWERCPSAAKDGEGQQGGPSQSPAATALPEGEPSTLSVSFADSSPKGRAKGMSCFMTTHQIGRRYTTVPGGGIFGGVLHFRQKKRHFRQIASTNRRGVLQ